VSDFNPPLILKIFECVKRYIFLPFIGLKFWIVSESVTLQARRLMFDAQHGTGFFSVTTAW
jgi:hypothetical protein